MGTISIVNDILRNKSCLLGKIGRGIYSFSCTYLFYIVKIMALYLLFYNAERQSNCTGAPLSFVPAHEKSFVLSIVSI